MHKRPNRATRWGLQVIALCGALLSFSVIGTLAVTTRTHAIQPLDTLTTSITTDTTTPLTATASSTPATPTSTTTSTATATKTPKPTQAPTKAPTQAPTQAPTTIAVGGTNYQPTTAPTTKAQATHAATATALPTDTPAPTDTSTSVATTSSVSAAHQQNSNSLLDTVFGTAGIIALLVIIFFAFLLIFIFVRRKKVQPLQAPGVPAMAGIPDSLVTPMPASLQQITPMPSLLPVPPTPFVQTEHTMVPGQMAYATQAIQTELQPMPQIPNTQLSMSQAPFQQNMDQNMVLPTPAVPSITEYSPLLNDHLLPQPVAQSMPVAQGQGLDIPSSDFNPLHLDYRTIMDGNGHQPSQAYAPVPLTPPATPPLTRSNLRVPSEQVTTGQLVTMMRQAQSGLFVIPDKETVEK